MEMVSALTEKTISPVSVSMELQEGSAVLRCKQIKKVDNCSNNDALSSEYTC